jgi:hypothetical protein
VDNKFANELVKTIGTEGLFPRSNKPTLLCGKCQKLDVFEPYFHIIDTWTELEANLSICHFCKMRFEVSQHFRAKNISPLRFDRSGSMLKLNEGELPVMSICRSSGESTINDVAIQYGASFLSKITQN